MKEFERLNKLVNEIVTLCETSEQETERIKEQAEAAKAFNFMMFCTELAPYWELEKKVGLNIKAQTGSYDEYEYYILFKERTVSLCRGITLGGGPYISILLTAEGDFKAFEQIPDLYKTDVLKVAREINWNIFEKSFATEIETTLIKRAEAANKAKKDALEKLKEVRT